jgi:L-asparaginase
MKKIALVSIGGTIAMQNNESGIAVPTTGAKELIGMIKSDKNNFILEGIEFKNIPSAHMSLEDLVALRNLVIRLSHSGYAGIVITHGTDTMEETAYFLDLTINLNVPVVLTGAQRNISALSPDIQLNLVDSILTAADDGALDKGVLIVFASEIITAREATKVHRTRTDTFKSMDFGPIGTVDNNRVIWTRKPLIRDTYEFDYFSKTKVDIIPSYLGADSRMLHNSVKHGVDGIVLQGLGAGHIPEAMIEGIEEAINASIPVVLSSRTLKGRFLMDTYGFIGGEKHLRKLGVIFGEDLTSQKVRIKLLVLLSTGRSGKEIQYEFEKNYYTD